MRYHRGGSCLAVSRRDVRSLPLSRQRLSGCEAHKFVRTIDWPFPMLGKPIDPNNGVGPDIRSSTADSDWMRARIHAAAGIGAREYSRRSPPSQSNTINDSGFNAARGVTPVSTS